MIALPPHITHDPIRGEPRINHYANGMPATQTVTGLRKPGQRSTPPLLNYDAIPRDNALLQPESLRNTNARSYISAKSETSFGILDYYLHSPTDSNADIDADSAIRRFDFQLEGSTETPLTEAHEDTPSLTRSESPVSPVERPRSSHRSFFRRTSKKPTSIPRRRRKAGSAWFHSDERRDSLSICCQGQVEPDLYGYQMGLPAMAEEPGRSPQYPPDLYSTADAKIRKDSGTSMTSSDLDLESRSYGTTSQASMLYPLSTHSRFSNKSEVSQLSDGQPLRQLRTSSPHISDDELSLGEALAEGDGLKPRRSLKFFGRSLSRRQQSPSTPTSALSSPRSPKSATSSKSGSQFVAAMKKFMPWSHANTKVSFDER